MTFGAFADDFGWSSSTAWAAPGCGIFSRVGRIASARLPRTSHLVAVGDIGCMGVDVEAFKRTCRAPMHPEGWNRWLLWRTTRDEPSALDIERSTYAVLGKWFELVENAEGISVPGRGAGKVDNVKIRVVPWDFVPPSWRVIARREDCTPLPIIAGNGAIGVLIEFVYRGQARDMPWPAHKAQILGPWCPVQADWLLARVYEPPSEHAPSERSAREELTAGVKRAADVLLPSPIGLGVAALAVLGVWTIGRALRR